LLGFIFAEASPRRAAALLDVPETSLSVAVFVRHAEERGADLVQLHPDDGGSVRSREAMLLRDGEPVARVLDQPWGGRDPDHWRAAAAAEGRIVLAGGLGAENVDEAIETVGQGGVDASSLVVIETGVMGRAQV